jgi:pyrroloquinoline quinone biosynthesis protein E
MLAGDMNAADPVCSKSPHHQKILDARAAAEHSGADTPITFRNERNSRVFARG